MVLKITASSPIIHNGGTSTVTADLTHDNTGADTSSQGTVPDGIPINFTSIWGSIGTGTTVNGRATTIFTAGSKPGIATINAVADGQTITTQITIGREDVYISPSGDDTNGDGSQQNPFKTIGTGISNVYPGGNVHIAAGTYTGTNNKNLVININMNIIGSGSGSTIIDAQELEEYLQYR